MRQKSSVHKERVFFFMALTALLILVLFLGGLILQTRREYNYFSIRQSELESRLLQVRDEFKRKEAYLGRLLEDPEFLERVARERLGYSRPDEILFRFEDEP